MRSPAALPSLLLTLVLLSLPLSGPTAGTAEDRAPLAAPGAPTDVAASFDASAVDLTVTWSVPVPETGVDRYEVHRSPVYDPTGAGYVRVSPDLPPGSTSWTDPGVGPMPGPLYYRVRAVATGGEASDSPGQAGKHTSPLGTGPRLASTTFIHAATALPDALTGTVSVETVRAFEAEDAADPWKRFGASRAGDLAAVDRRMGLWLDVTAAGDLRIAGVVPCLTQILLRPGWNLVGFPSATVRTVSAATAGLQGPLALEGPDPGRPPYFLRRLSAGDVVRPMEALWILSPVMQTWTVANDPSPGCQGTGGLRPEPPGPPLAVDVPIAPGPATNVSIVPSYRGDVSNWSAAAIEDAHALLRDAGVRVVHHYRTWGELETSAGTYDWADLDFYATTAADRGLRLSLVVKVIDNNQVGALPADVSLTAFDDPVLMARFRTFLLDLSARYSGSMDYLWIGNEIDNYLHPRRSMLDGFVALYGDAYGAVKAAHPGLRIGTISTFHDARGNGALDIVETVGARGDLLGFSFYPQLIPGAGPEDTSSLMDEMSASAARAGRPFAITETGWSSDGFGSFPALQEFFVRELMGAYGSRRGTVPLLGLFLLYDYPADLTEALASYYGIGYGDYVAWLGTLGLGHNDGEAKRAWGAFLEEMRTLAAS